MRILNLGSLNIDRVYNVNHFVQSGETILANSYETFCGGKGMNQSIAIARAGGTVFHAGAVGTDGGCLCRLMEQEGVRLDFLQKLDTVSGHAIIQINGEGQNSIIVCPGANNKLQTSYIGDVIDAFSLGDILLLQNETANVDYAIKKGSTQGMKIVFNPSPITEKMLSYPMELVDYFILNEVEGRMLANYDGADHQTLLHLLATHYPHAAIVLTVGKEGSYYHDSDTYIHQSTYDIPVVDTTAAGDTFCGYFIAMLARGESPETALEYASLASNLAVSKKGASVSIPTQREVKEFRQTCIIKTF